MWKNEDSASVTQDPVRVDSFFGCLRPPPPLLLPRAYAIAVSIATGPIDRPEFRIVPWLEFHGSASQLAPY